MVALAAELLFSARRQREFLTLMQGDYEDTWAQGPSRRGRVCFGRSYICD